MSLPLNAFADVPVTPVEVYNGFDRGLATNLFEATIMRYTVVLEQEEDGGFVVAVPALPGCFSQGDSRDEALANIREAIELYIEDCRDAGDPVPTDAGKEFVEIEAA
jgi:predicted RNase H-like HicB family nuclease